jgi:hypothetical protein
MGRTYTYEPEKISENGKDRMRFELGDTTTLEALLAVADELSEEGFTRDYGCHRNVSEEVETGKAGSAGKYMP